jgi:capsular polysaccharide biosynthesis protein
LTFFRDGANNEDKKQRANRMRERLVGNASRESHPGVFLLRGDSGDRRVLLNENEIAQGLMSRRGFKVVDPIQSSLEEITEACAGARVVAGVEGSQLVHGLVMMPPDAALFVIQPPHRVVSTLKLVTDRQGQTYSFLVASGGKEDFSVAMGDVERTLDLVDAC